MTNPSLRIVFAGTPDFAAGHLDSLVKNGCNVVGVFTQPDRPAGRGKKIQPTPVKRVAESHTINVFQPQRLDAEAVDQLKVLAPDLLIVVAYGIILKQDILAIPRFGCINVHASLLPRWRGAAPIERAILAGDTETGVSIMQMDAGLDTGDVLLRLSTPIAVADNAMTITDRLLALGCEGLLQVLKDLPASQAAAEKQDDSLATYAAKLARDDAALDWRRPALDLQHQVQAFYPRSPAFFKFRDEHINEPLRVITARRIICDHGKPPGTIIHVDKSALLVACAENALEITHLQLPGKKPARLQDILNGHPDLFVPGDMLASPDS